MELILKPIRYWKIFILFFLINSAILITPFSLQGEQAYTDFSVDTGTLIVQDSIDAGGNSFMFTDNVSVLNNVVINNFSVDDVIQILNAEEGMYSFSNDGRDVVIVYNNNGVINKIELKDVVDSTALIYDEASFENNIGFDAFTIAGDEWAMPGKASLISPSERVANKNPTFIWNEVPNATWYRLFIWDEHEDTVFRQWYEASQICLNGQCSASTDMELKAGKYEWFVKSWNNHGKIWSDGMAFTVQDNETLPSKVIHISPDGITPNQAMIFTWVADPVSTWYKLWIGHPNNERIFSQWYEASTICSDGDCAVTVEAELNSGNYMWYIKSWNDDGKIWSDGMNFSLTN